MLRLLLRPRDAIAGPPGPATARLLGRGDARHGEPGWRAQLARAFRVVPAGLPVAALTRQADCGDAALHAWLRADPSHVRADMATARLVACGEMGLAEAEVGALLRSLKPAFGDAGFPISAPVAGRWYLMLPKGTALPAFHDPHEALGAPMDEYLPAGDAGRRWRHLLNEAQVILHNHPLNAERAAAGKLPVNSLWFWGAGSLPDSVQAPFARVATGDLLLGALARQAGCALEPATAWPALPQAQPPGDGAPAAVDRPEPRTGALVDLRDLRAAEPLERDWVAPAVAAGAPLELDFGDGTQVSWRPSHRWRWWRRPAAQFG